MLHLGDPAGTVCDYIFTKHYFKVWSFNTWSRGGSIQHGMVSSNDWYICNKNQGLCVCVFSVVVSDYFVCAYVHVCLVCSVHVPCAYNFQGISFLRLVG